MSLNFLLIEVRFLTVVRSAFVPSIAMISANQVSIFKERNKEFEQVFNPDGFCFLKSDILW
jgi:hypothetical protein